MTLLRSTARMLALFVIGFAAFLLAHLSWHGFAIWIGITNGSGHAYLFWSGIGANFGEFAIAGVIWRRFNCHEPGCMRIALHHYPDGQAHCHKHAPRRDEV